MGESATQRSAFGGGNRVFQGTLRNQAGTSRKLFQAASPGQQIDEDDDEDEEETPSSAFQESSSVYQIHKILSSDQYTIGKSVSEYIESFHMQYKNLKESSEFLPQPMESI